MQALIILAGFAVLAWVIFVAWLVQRFLLPKPAEPPPAALEAAFAGEDDTSGEHPFRLPAGIERDYYKGAWERKFRMNLPGPFYSTTENVSSSPTALQAPDYIMETDGDEGYCQFFWRQPESAAAKSKCLEAMKYDDTASYQIDGNSHWTAELVRAWWREKPRLLAWANAALEEEMRNKDSEFYSPQREGLLHVYIRFLNEDAEYYLQRYVFFLDHGALPGVDDALPQL